MPSPPKPSPLPTFAPRPPPPRTWVANQHPNASMWQAPQSLDLAGLADTLFQEAGDALFLFDPDTERLLRANPMAQQLSGFREVELQRMQVDYLFRPEVPSRGGMHRLREAYRKTGLFHAQEGYVLRHQQDGVWTPVNLTVARLHAEGRTFGLITARDVRERRQAQLQLQQKDAELRQVLSSVSVYLWSMDVDADGRWNLRYLSPVVERITGHPAQFYFGDGARWWSTVHPEDRSRLEHVYARLRRERLPGSEEEYRIVRPDGTVRWVHDSVTATWIDGGPAFRLDGVVTDVTERKQAVQALLASEAKYRSLLDNLEQCIFLKDQHYRFIAANAPFCQAVGRLEAELLGKTDFDLYPRHLAEKYRADDQRVLTEGQRLEIEEQGLIQNRLRTVRGVKTPVRDDDGCVVGVQGIFWDVTEQRELEAQLRQAQKMEAVGRLAGGVAHDFNNLLTGILGNAALLLSRLPPGDPCREWAVAVEKAAERAANLTHQMLGFSRKMVLLPQPINLNETVTEVIGLLRSTFDPRIRLEVRTAAELWPVHADPGQMTQVLMNLCLNARDALPDGGELLLQTENVCLGPDAPSRHVEAEPGAYVRLRVRDSGVGIAADVLPHIFEPFFTTKGPGKGSGLGLSMVYGIVRQHHGWVHCSSHPGHGTCFEVYLPRHPDRPGAGRDDRTGGRAERAEFRTPNAAPGATILLADDEPILRDLGRTILERHGFRVLLAEDGQQAVDVMGRQGDAIDLVILDLTMPRLSGRDAFRQILRRHPTARILFASGYSTDYLGELEQERMLGFVAKPYHPDELIAVVRRALTAKH